jgi:hypothetical protein
MIPAKQSYPDICWYLKQNDTRNTVISRIPVPLYPQIRWYYSSKYTDTCKHNHTRHTTILAIHRYPQHTYTRNTHIPAAHWYPKYNDNREALLPGTGRYPQRSGNSDTRNNLVTKIPVTHWLHRYRQRSGYTGTRNFHTQIIENWMSWVSSHLCWMAVSSSSDPPKT